MQVQSDSPISVEIIARSGRKSIRIRVIIPMIALVLLISAVTKLLG